MTINEQLELYMKIRTKSDEKLKEELRNRGIKEENLDVAFKIMMMLPTTEGQREIVSDLIKDDINPDGCPGAIEPVYAILGPSTIPELAYLKANNISGIDLYTLWNDCANRDQKKFIFNIKALQSGVYRENEIDENFNINRNGLSGTYGVYAKREKDKRWFSRYQRAKALPFVYDEDVINPSDYFEDQADVNPNDKNFKEFVQVNRVYQRLNYLLSKYGLLINSIKVTGKNEITLSMILPTYKADSNNKMQWVQNISDKNETFVLDTNKLSSILNNNDMMSIINYLNDCKKVANNIKHM